MKTHIAIACLFFLASMPIQSVAATAQEGDGTPPAAEQQLRRQMRSAMSELPRITVGQTNAELLGNDNRSLQAAVDFVAALVLLC